MNRLSRGAFDVDRGDVLAARGDGQVLLAAGDREEPVLAELAQIAGAQPSLGVPAPSRWPDGGPSRTGGQAWSEPTPAPSTRPGVACVCGRPGRSAREIRLTIRPKGGVGARRRRCTRRRVARRSARWDPGSADYIVGTSAGAMIGALARPACPLVHARALGRRDSARRRRRRACSRRCHQVRRRGVSASLGRTRARSLVVRRLSCRLVGLHFRGAARLPFANRLARSLAQRDRAVTRMSRPQGAFTVP
jgi:hypothetical protein